MKPKLSELTHAQARFYRRMHNSRGAGQPSLVAYIGKKGEPIPGKLSEVELAHKARRVARRPIILARRRKQFEVELMMKVRDHRLLKEGETAKERVLKEEIRVLQSKINIVVIQLGRLDGTEPV